MSVHDPKRLKRLDRLAWLLDSAIPIPGLKKRMGLDGLIGLIPGVGDLVGALFSSYILLESARMGLPKPILFKMALNIALDSLVGAVPVLGDLFDIAWKANRRNVNLLIDYLEAPQQRSARSLWALPGVILFLTSLFLAVGLFGFLIFRLFWQGA